MCSWVKISRWWRWYGWRRASAREDDGKVIRMKTNLKLILRQINLNSVVSRWLLIQQFHWEFEKSSLATPSQLWSSLATVATFFSSSQLPSQPFKGLEMYNDGITSIPITSEWLRATKKAKRVNDFGFSMSGGRKVISVKCPFNGSSENMRTFFSLSTAICSLLTPTCFR